LHENGSHTSIGVRSGKLRSALVIAEMALTVVLVVGAALLIRTFMKLESVDPGFVTHNVISMSMSVSGDRFQKTAPVAQMIQEGTDLLHGIPGIIDAGVSNCLPMAGGFEMTFDVVGRP
jgi:putative ABC transport system permease protein